MDRIIDFLMMLVASVLGLLLASCLHWAFVSMLYDRKRKKRSKSK